MKLYFRKVKNFGPITPHNPGVTLEFRREITWYEEKSEDGVTWNGNNSSGKTDRFLIVRGQLVEKGQTYPVEWKFPLPEKAWNAISEGINEVLNTTKAKRENGVELERYMDFDYLRVSVTTPVAPTGDGSAYLEFTQDNHKIRADFANALELDQFLVAGRNLFTPGSP